VKVVKAKQSNLLILTLRLQSVSRSFCNGFSKPKGEKINSTNPNDRGYVLGVKEIRESFSNRQSENRRVSKLGQSKWIPLTMQPFITSVCSVAEAIRVSRASLHLLVRCVSKIAKVEVK